MARALNGEIPIDPERLAGTLAELGCRAVRLDGRDLSARATDLPGELRGAATGATLACDEPALTITLLADRWAFSTGDESVASALASLGQ